MIARYIGSSPAADGYLVDSRGYQHHPDRNPKYMDAVGDRELPLAYYVNGIDSRVDNQLTDMRRASQKFGYKVLGVHNATEGMVSDLLQCAGDKVGLGHNPAVTTVRGLILSAVESGESLALIGHSQGALICTRALWQARKELRRQGLDKKEIAAKLGSVTFHTAGAAAYRFPKGPHYHHHVNALDPVTWVAGFMLSLPFINPGHGGTVETFAAYQKPQWAGPKPAGFFTCVHSTDVYFAETRHAKPFQD